MTRERTFLFGLAGGYVCGLLAPYALGGGELSLWEMLAFGGAVLAGFLSLRWWMRPWR